MKRSLKYLSTRVVFQEIPGEITLAINISGCPYRCEGCHSPELWEDAGQFISDSLSHLIEKNDGITCVCFMGGDQNIEELEGLGEIVTSYGLKSALYSGNDDFEFLSANLPSFTYIKYGRWIEELGGLINKNTNQRLMKREGDSYRDITSHFFSSSVI